MTTRERRLPAVPYRGLAYYDAEDALLFEGRDQDVDDCVQFLAEPATRMLVLHGRTGCGKSSFLRAGLIPELEERGFGFQFLRNAKDEVVFIRAGADPVARIAEQLFEFASRPQRVLTERGPQTLDLSGARLGHVESGSFMQACRGPEVLMRAFSELSRVFLHTLVIILDQAEEVLTLTDNLDERRQAFFTFLKEFNSTNLDVKFVIALRKEHFGEFFSYVQLDHSLKTDVKHFLLPELDRQKVLEAIELPTSRSPREGKLSPYEKYGFEFEPGLAKTIRDDLFEAAPTGGVLPVMQIVCRDLYNEVSSGPVPRVIDMPLYLRGNRVTGRVDRHVSTALRASFKGQLPESEFPSEERRWRGVLMTLVRRDSDGTVTTDVVTAKRLEEIAKKDQVKCDKARVFSILSQPDTLVLRQFSLRNEGYEEQLVYSLGHDAIGLSLHEWKLREEEAEKRIQAERKYRIRTWVAAAVISVITAISLGALWRAMDVEQKAKAQRVDSLTFASKRVSQRYPELATLAAIEAMKAEEAGPRFYSRPLSQQHGRERLAEILAASPKMVAQKEGFQQPWLLAHGTFLIPRGKADIQSINPVYGEMMYPNVLDNPRGKVFSVVDASEVGPGVIVLVLSGTDPRPGAELEPSKVVVLQGGKVRGEYPVSYFLDRASHIKAVLGRNRENKPWIYLSGNTVHLTTSAQDDYSEAIFELQPSSEENALRLRGVYRKRLRDKSATFATFSVKAFGGILVEHDTGQVGLSTPTRSKFPEMRAIDVLQQEVQLWTTEDLEQTDAITQCRQVSKTRSCAFNFVERSEDISVGSMFTTPGDRLLGLLVSISEATNERPERSDQRSSERLRGPPSVLVLIDVRTGKAMDVNFEQLLRLSPEYGEAKGVPSQARSRLPYEPRNVLFAGDLDDLFIAIPENRALHVFRVESRTPRFVGTMLWVADTRRLRLSLTPSLVMGMEGSRAVSWDLSTPTKTRGEALSKMTTEALIRIACEGDFVREVEKALWITETTLYEPPPSAETLCAPYNRF